MDVPYIAKKTRAQVIGNLNATNLMLVNKIPEDQLITVKGGEDYEFGNFSVRVTQSLHGALNHKHYFDPDVIPPYQSTARKKPIRGGWISGLFDPHWQARDPGFDPSVLAFAGR